MKPTDLTIASRLYVGVGTILLFVVILGGLAWRQADLMGMETKSLYDHPLQVRRLVGEIKADILAMHRGMKDLFLAENEQERQTVLQTIAGYESRAHERFELLSSLYLGPPADIAETRRTFSQWKPIRSEVIRLLREGKTAEAASHTKSTGVGGRHVEKLFKGIRRIDDYARNRADKFYEASEDLHSSLRLQLAAVICLILLLSLALSYSLLRGIKTPLRDLTRVANAQRAGRIDARSSYVSANEIGQLATAMNQMADRIETELSIKGGAVLLAEAMLRKQDLPGFCREVLGALIEQTGSQVGAIYLLNEEKTAFDHCDSIGLSESHHGSFSAVAREGEFGKAIASHRIEQITDIPADSRFTFKTVSGNFLPRGIITIPIVAGEEVSAVISLAGVQGYSEDAVRLVNEIWSHLTARMNGVLAYQKIHGFSKMLGEQNRELEIQKQALVTQAEELTEQNTELELQRRKLAAAGRLKSVFLANMSHELRTPLNSVIALAGVLARRLAATIPKEEYGYIEVIERNGKQLLTLINDLLDLSRIEAGREEVAITRCSIRLLVDETVAMLESQASEKGITLKSDLPKEFPSITSDPGKLRHILQNLVGNAVKFTERGGVTITAEVSAKALVLDVIDTGVGIAEDQLPHVFDEFRQVDGSASRRFGGTGLGLAIARRYAHLLQGEIAVKSSLGRGSTFTLTLPRILAETGGAYRTPDPPAGPEGSAAAPSDGTPRSRGGHDILLVEDSEAAIVQMTDILAGQGYMLRVARNGREALDQISSAVPDAIILDLTMPEVDGFQTLEAIRGKEETAQLPVLILTAKHVTNEDLEFLTYNGVHQLIQKGDISPEELLAAVAALVATETREPVAPQRHRGAGAWAGKPVILVVEDNSDNMTTIRALLHETCTIHEARDGETCLDQAREHKPDIILMDLSLPGMDGFAVLSAIREDQDLRLIPVVAVTARAMNGDREEILARGFDGYVSKPIDNVALQNVIEGLLHDS